MKTAPESPPALRALDESFVEALTVAMVVAPGVYARNRMFQFFARPGVKRAQRRAAALRGIIPQLRRATTLTIESEASRSVKPGASRARSGIVGGGASDEGAGGGFVLRYSIAALRLSRVIELTATELAALRLLASRADVRALPPEPSDGELVDSVLARLVDGGRSDEGPTSPDVVRRLRESVAPRTD